MKEYYSAKEMSALLNISYVALTKWIKEPKTYNLPPHIIVGKNSIRFPCDRYQEWRANQ